MTLVFMLVALVCFTSPKPGLSVDQQKTCIELPTGRAPELYWTHEACAFRAQFLVGRPAPTGTGVVESAACEPIEVR